MDYVYVWADGIHVNVRLEETKLCLLVLIGVRADGRKELIALDDGYREATESWADLLRDCKRRGMRAPVLAIGDGALGFWGALREVFPETKEQRCWFHKIANVLAALPKSAHPGAKKALAEIWNAEDKRHALNAVKAFEAAYGAKYPKAVAKITDDLDQLLAFYDFPAEHWVHLRTTNPIESTFSTVRNRSKITKGPGSRAAGIAVAYKLIEAAQSRWRAVNAPHLVALVRPAPSSRTANSSNAPTNRPPRKPGRRPPEILHPQILTIALGVSRRKPMRVVSQTSTPSHPTGQLGVACRADLPLHPRVTAAANLLLGDLFGRRLLGRRLLDRGLFRGLLGRAVLAGVFLAAGCFLGNSMPTNLAARSPTARVCEATVPSASWVNSTAWST
ncbi:transposase, Mutator family protein [Mycobacterium xenopi 4042]|uniref:Mutator family transposase n=1 Tax=Mycobacterium xenopi 4042 TaxID=1299334 RepID=X8DMF6_MYCXE|nr:transposase, Mutator family protein [Mycobacterium xenopi 4042]